ncbi:MAG TPA: alpha/beta hydrolase [Kiloniellaceae bacterium]|nr:alpha/beta hydrolase [Kiloniellaceae bacterium]
MEDPPPRLGPRPLPLHLLAAGLTWSACRSALPLWSSGSLSSSETQGKATPGNGELAARAAALRQSLEGTDPAAFARAVEREVARRLATLADGIEAYRRHPWRRDLADPPALWREGSCRLLDYGAVAGGAARGQPVLVVPSLINRAYVLDLTAERSLLRWLAARGLRPLLLDWGRPGAEERGFTLTDYVTGRLSRALDALLADAEAPPVVLGYCMGGLLALGLALARQRDLAGLALLATPWDFHADGAIQARMAAAALPLVAPLLEVAGEMPVDLLQALFASLDPQLVVRKFIAFGRLDPAGRKAADFVALEDWLNDGVPLAAPVARECLGRWYGDNATARGQWRLAGRVVDPAALRLPALCVIPAQDRIVPPASALALAEAIPGAARLAPAAGHIGMVVGAQAERQVWEPLLTWIRDRSSAAR